MSKISKAFRCGIWFLLIIMTSYNYIVASTYGLTQLPFPLLPMLSAMGLIFEATE